MLTLLVFSCVVAVSQAIVCLPNFCDNVKQPLLDCKGGIIKHGGFCGCTDICARIEGESCEGRHLFGVPNLERCDEGLACVPFMLEGAEGHKCMNASLITDPNKPIMEISRRDTKRMPSRCDTPCRKKMLQCTFSMVVYEGQWFAKCDTLGNFLPEQCDKTNHCFCVDRLTGAVQDGTKVLGSANC